MTRIQTSLLLLVLTGPLALAQEETRTGIVGAPAPPRAFVQSSSELEARDLLPKGYSYVFTGKVEGKRLVVTRVSLRSPDEQTRIFLERVEGTFAARRLPLPSGKVVLKRGSRPVRLETGTHSQLDRYLSQSVDCDGPGNFTIRGWSITRERGDQKRRSILLDGIDVRVRRAGLDHVWAERVYDRGQTVLLESEGAVQSGVKRKHVRINRLAKQPFWLPAFYGQPDEVQQRGVIGDRQPRTSISNYAELRRIGVFRDGDAYTFKGATEGQRFLVGEMAFVSPGRSRRQALARFEGVFQVREAGGRLVLSHEGVDRTLLRNPISQLDRYLQQALRRDGPGEFKLRGWTVTTQDGSGPAQAALLDGVEVMIEREGLASAWAERVYDKGRTVLLEPTGSVQRGVKSRFVELVRRAPSAGMTKALSAKPR